MFVFEGGSRSSKTYSIIQFLLIYALSNQDRTNRVLISRKKGTWLSSTVWTDFQNILVMTGLMQDCSINKTLKIVHLYTTTFEFVGLDDVQKLHGLTSDIVWINEAMECNKDDFDQLEQRCSRFMILDYNPSAEEHWIYDKVIGRKDCYFDHSTMIDNPFIPDNMRRKILSYEPTEYNYSQGTVDKRKWLIYGLGKRAKIEGLVFDNWKIIKEVPLWVKERYYGLDFGYSSDPTACEEVGFLDNAIYLDEKFYTTGMLTKDIIEGLRPLPRRKIWSESADPRLVDEIYNAGFNIEAVRKYAGSIEAGIDWMKGHRMYVTENSIDLIRELKNYTWQQDKNGKWLNVPVDSYNHCIDGIRYVCLMERMGQKEPVKDFAGVFR
ncbi:MAG: PBSX family phage terminase large subunit [Bacteroidales bacterium]|nr:PBSX family phage terminase large subunit [Bacteroidales bacterium]